MKIIFFGTSDFAVSALDELFLSKHLTLAVVTAGDKRRGRGKKIGFSPVKIVAQKKGLPVFQPEDLRDTKFIQSLKNISADLFVVCAFGKILTKEILQIPKTYAINLHASLLPQYRGAAPINWAIIHGERETGVTIFKMDEYMDKGQIILQKKINIVDTDTAVSLTDKLANIGKKALRESLDLIATGGVTFTAQDEISASSAPKLKKEDGLIDWQRPASEIHNRIKGLQPWPCAFTYFENKLLKIWESKVVPGKTDRAPAEIVEIKDKEGILVQTGKDRLLLTSLQLEGKKRMPAAEFILGHKMETGKKMGKSK